MATAKQVTEMAIESKPARSLFEMRQQREELFEQFFNGIIEQATFTEEQNLAIREVLAAKSQDALGKRDDIVELINAAKDERDRLKRQVDAAMVRIRQFDTFESTFRESIKLQMETLGVKRVEGSIHRLLLRDGKDSVEITDLAALPPEFINYKPEADKNAISKALHEGQSVPGAELVPARKSLVIS